MDSHSSNPDDLRKLEQRLAGWKPTPEGLDLEAMLFAAGRASARHGKAWLAWPIACGCLALAVVVLGAGLATERSERLALLREIGAATAKQEFRAPLSAGRGSDETPVTTPPGPDSYLVLRREWEERHGDWANRPGPSGRESKPASPQPTILRAWQPGGPPEPL
jgi:hypothetical protein